MRLMIQTWQVKRSDNQKLEINASTFDEIAQLLPEGYYSTFRTFNGGTRVLGLASHLQRLYEPVSTPDVEESVLRRRLFGLLETFRPGEARVRAVMTRQGQVYIAISPLLPLPRELYEKGVHVETTELQREHPRLKSTAFISRSDSERRHIAQEGIFEALLVKEGTILEGMTSNFFYVGQVSNLPHLGTASNDILLGITRETVLDIARSRGLTVTYEPLKLEQLKEISEAFITSSSRGVVPVIQIDDVMVGEGSPGPITREFMSAYDSYVLEHAEKI